MQFTPEAEANLRRANIAVEEFWNGYRAADSCLVATRLAFFHKMRFLPTRRKTKIPCVKGWTECASADLGQILRWRERFNSDFSILTGIAGGVWALDIDGPQGATDLKRLTNELGPLPSTIKTISGRATGGFHLWFKACPAAEDLRTVSKVLGSNIDVRGGGGQIVLAGSEHRSGSRYMFAPGCAPDEVDLAELPQSWVTALPKRIPAGTPVPRSSKRHSPPCGRIQNERSIAIGDGEGRGGFHRPIYLSALQLIRDAGADADATVIASLLRMKVRSAPVDSARPQSDLDRYLSEAYLRGEIERARSWLLGRDQNEDK